MATPHISSAVGDIAKTVLMPGDPRRSEFIAKNFLKDAKLVNDVRGVHGYTGTWKGVPVSVMASGMGMPSIGIYSWELFNFYDVDNIIRVGSAGAISDDLHVMDIVAAMGACIESSYISNFGLPGTFAPIADYKLLSTAVEAARELNIDLKVGNILSSDNFYSAFDNGGKEKWKKMGVLATEMESGALYANAAYAGKHALCICTISDHLFKDENLSSDERETGFSSMITVALDTAAKIGK